MFAHLLFQQLDTFILVVGDVCSSAVVHGVYLYKEAMRHTLKLSWTLMSASTGHTLIVLTHTIH